VADAAGGLACLVLVWPADARMPTARAERRQARKSGGRQRCREDVLAVVREAGTPLSRKEVVRALKDAGKQHGASTVAKALADLTEEGKLVNLRDKRGYRLAGWPRPDQTPSLFH
jgi:Fe2+ or Zn2+ uptake regulation protein